MFFIAAKNGFVILIGTRSQDAVWAYHFSAAEESRAKRAFAKLVADELREPVAVTIEKFQSGAFSAKGMKNAFRAEVGDVRLSFFPTAEMGDYGAAEKPS